MHGMGLYTSMDDDQKEEERFSDEMGGRGNEESDASSNKSPTSGSSSNPEKKKKRKSRKPSSRREDMTEEELIASARRSRESVKMAEAESGGSGLFAPHGPAASMRSAAKSSSKSRTDSKPGSQSLVGPNGVDQAMNVMDDGEDPFARPSRAQPNDGQREPPKSRTSSKPKKEINKDFKDVRETGRWGTVSKKEMYAVGIVALLVIIGVVVAVVVVTTRDNEPAPAPASTNPVPPGQAPTLAPTARVVLTPQEQLDVIRSATIDNPATQGNLASLPEDASFYEGKADDPTAEPVVRAASWIMFDDPIDNEEWLIVRYSLAVLYYSTNGDDWTAKDGWLTDASACDWLGNRCDRFDKAVEEIDLSSNNLSGVVPDEMNMVSSLISLWLRDNNLSGSVPSVSLGSIPQLSILYVDNNSLEGTIGAELAASGALKTLFLQGNDLTGILPIEFCPEGGEGGLLEFGIDCDKMECFCCFPAINCF